MTAGFGGALSKRYYARFPLDLHRALVARELNQREWALALHVVALSFQQSNAYRGRIVMTLAALFHSFPYDASERTLRRDLHVLREQGWIDFPDPPRSRSAAYEIRLGRLLVVRDVSRSDDGLSESADTGNRNEERETTASDASLVQASPGVYDNDNDNVEENDDDERAARESSIDQELAVAGWVRTQRAGAKRDPERAVAWCRAAASAAGVTNPAAWGYSMFMRGGWPPTPRAGSPVATATLTLEDRAYRWVNETDWQFQEADFLDLLRYDWVEKSGLATASVPSLTAVYRQQVANRSSGGLRSTTSTPLPFIVATQPENWL